MLMQKSKIYNAVLLIMYFLSLFMIIFSFGQFIEGPPYRVIVRGLPFIFGILLMSFSTAVSLRLKNDNLFILNLIIGGVIPIGYILTIQQYYNGGINVDYRPLFYVFSSFMFGISVLYIYTFIRLFFRIGRKSSHKKKHCRGNA